MDHVSEKYLSCKATCLDINFPASLLFNDDCPKMTDKYVICYWISAICAYCKIAKYK